MKKLVFYLITFILGFSACQKANNTFELEKNFKTLTKEEIELIGKEHNRLCIEVIKNLKYNSMTIKTDQVQSQSVYESNSLSSKYENLLNSMNYIYTTNSYRSISESEFEDYIKNYSVDAISNTINTTINNISNAQQSLIMEDLFRFINSSSNYEVLSHMLNQLKQRAENELTGLDQTSTLIAIEVAINSANMWLPIYQGGLGYFEQIGNFQRVTLESNNSLINIESRDIGSKFATVICSDAIGAFSGFCRAALPYFLSGGPVNPISNGILFGSALIMGTSSSLTAAVGTALR
jgi:hypothetical protein